MVRNLLLIHSEFAFFGLQIMEEVNQKPAAPPPAQHTTSKHLISGVDVSSSQASGSGGGLFAGLTLSDGHQQGPSQQLTQQQQPQQNNQGAGQNAAGLDSLFADLSLAPSQYVCASPPNPHAPRRRNIIRFLRCLHACHVCSHRPVRLVTCDAVLLPWPACMPSCLPSLFAHSDQ